MSQILQHVIESITPASAASGEAAATRVAGVGAPVLERLARTLGGAQHTSKPRGSRRRIVVAAGDHGVGDPGIAMGADHPTIVAARAIADGSAALCQLARSAAQTPIVLVDAGTREPRHMPGIAVSLGRGPSRDLMREPTMTVVDAVLGLEAGIALAISLSEPVRPAIGWGTPEPDPARPAIGWGTPEPDPARPAIGWGTPEPAGGTPEPAGRGTPDEPDDAPAGEPALDLLAIGALGVGAEVASAALLGAVTGRAPLGLGDAIAEAAGARAAGLATASGLEMLAMFGGSETAVLAGLLLGCASINVPVVLDGYATGAAALIAAVLAPNVTGYLIAAHRGSFTQPAIIAHLGLDPVFEVGLGHGEGSGAAMALPLVDQVAALVAGR